MSTQNAQFRARETKKIEDEVLKICLDVLKLTIDSFDDKKSFLLQGGDSLLAIKFMARCRMHGIGISTVDIIKSQTIAHLCQQAYLLPDHYPPSDQVPVRNDTNPLPANIHNVQLSNVDTSIRNTLSEEFMTKLQRLSGSDDFSIEKVTPCSAAQERMLTSQSINPRMYQCCFALNFSSVDPNFHLSSRRIGKSWEKVVQRHSVLRTIFTDDHRTHGQFCQVVLNSIRVEVHYYEGTKFFSHTEHETGSALGFGTCSLPHRMRLVQASPSQVHALFEISHAVADGHSCEIILQDLCNAYNGNEIGSAVLMYSDFCANMQDRVIQPHTIEASSQLPQKETMLLMNRTHEPPLNLKTVTLEMTYQQQLEKKRELMPEITMATICQLAWALVLRFVTASQQVCFTFADSGRSGHEQGLYDAVGPFAQSHLCTIDLCGNESINEALRKVAGESQKAVFHEGRAQEAGFETIRNSARQMCNTTMSFQHALDLEDSIGVGFKVDLISKYLPTDYDVALYLTASPDRLSIDLDFWETRLEYARAEKFLVMFQQAILFILRDGERNICETDLLNPKDLEMLQLWNSEFPQVIEACVNYEIAKVVQRQPQKLAIRSFDGDLTYEHLLSHSISLAYQLQKRGVGTEVAVGVCMSKSKWAIVAMLGILFAGGVVVPFGVTHPTSRIEKLLNDVGCPIVLVDRTQEARLSSVGNAAELLVISDLTIYSPPEDCDTLAVDIRPENAAWIIFTSGSTGTPKGVVLEHRNLMTALSAHGSLFGIGNDTRAAQFAAFTFDVSISDILMTLLFGGCICVMSEEDRLNDLSKALQILEVNTVNLTPTVLGLLDPADLPLISTVLSGGEPLDPTIVEKWGSKARLFNTYGPSECTIMSVCNGPVKNKSHASNVGYPTGCRLWVTHPDNSNKLCPIGIEGELLIEGPIVSRGYLNDEKRTRQAFIEPLFSQDLHLSNQSPKFPRRMYRSGDLVRQNDDGSITHLGRWDNQVKIRGQRVDVGEIEHCIARGFSQIRLAVVVVDARGQKNEQKSLVAVIELEDETKYTPDAASVNRNAVRSDLLNTLDATETLAKLFGTLQKSLFELLPSYMVPNMFVPVSKMPINQSQKIDRRAVASFVSTIELVGLQKYLPKQRTVQTAFSGTERRLCELWASILRVDIDTIDAEDHFFRLGGDSVAAMRAVVKGRELGLFMTVAEIHQYPRLYELAQALEGRTTNTDPGVNVPIEPFALWQATKTATEELQGSLLENIAARCNLYPSQIEDIYPATALQEALLALSVRQPSAYTNVETWTIKPHISVDRFQSAWNAVIARNPILRTRILMDHDNMPIQVVVKEVPVWDSMSSLDYYLEQRRYRAISPGRLLNRFALIKEPSGETYFVWTAHHSTYDGWSKNLILQEVAHAYYERPLSRPVSFTRFISHLNQKSSADSVKFWRAQLQGEIGTEFPALPYPTYQPRPRMRERYQMSLPTERDPDILVADILRAAWAVVVSQYSGCDFPLFAVALSGRDAPVDDITEMAAPTLATVPVKVHIKLTQTVSQFLSNIRQQRVDMIPHTHTGLTKIRQFVLDLTGVFDLRHLFLVQHGGLASDQSLIPGVESFSTAQDEFDSYMLNVECTIQSESIGVDVRFDDKAIPCLQLTRVMNQFEHVFTQLCNPNLANFQLGQLQLTNLKDLKTIKNWNYKSPTPVERCLHDLVSDMVSQQPDAIAIEAWDGSLTYRQLEAYSKKFAARLVDCGVEREVPVAVCMDKSVFTIVAYQAILLAGGVVVPLGVNHPVTRLQSLMVEAKVNIVLTDSLQAQRLADLTSTAGPNGKMLSSMVIDRQLINSVSSDNMKRHKSAYPSNAAWIVFTSGSTGVPKAAVLEHQSLSTSILAHGERFGFCKRTRTIQFAAHVFDAVIQDYFTTLIHGGTVCVPSEESRQNELAVVMKRMKVNLINCTSTVASLFGPTDVPTLDTMILSGEPIQSGALQRWYQAVDIINCYGIAECSIDTSSTYKKRLQAPGDAAGIGYPLGTRVWITDPYNPNRLSPVGAFGEMLIEGPPVGRGYLNNPGKTAESFITRPDFIQTLGLDCGQRFYRSGDLGRQNEDGSLFHLGRIDTQVKIRGQRVDIGEIEHWLAQKIPNARHVAIIPHVRGDGKQQVLIGVIEMLMDSLVAVSEVQNKITLQQPIDLLRAMLRRVQTELFDVLPAYMVPHTFLRVDEMKLGTTGKLDRRAISQMIEAMDAEAWQTCAITCESFSKTVVQTSTEKFLQALWAQALGIEANLIGRDDHFFQIGGDSVVAMKVVAAASIQRKANLPVPTVAEIFQHPQLHELASTLDGRATSSNEVDSENTSQYQTEKSSWDDDSEDDEPFSMLAEVIGS